MKFLTFLIYVYMITPMVLVAILLIIIGLVYLFTEFL